jgi:hypothetical protein
MIVEPVVIGGLPSGYALIGHGWAVPTSATLGVQSEREDTLTARRFPELLGGKGPNENSIPADVNNNGLQEWLEDGIMYPQRICTVT